MAEPKYRLITRADFDGVVCGALFSELNMIDDIVFAEPNDMQQGQGPVSSKDVSANLPYVEGIHQYFDHHRSELKRVGEKENLIIDGDAPSAARVVYRHFGGKDGFPDISEELLDAVDQADSAQYSVEDIMAPEKWTLLNLIIDPRTGMKKVDGFNIAHNAFLYDVMTYCRHTPIDEILQLPDVQELVNSLMYQREFAELQLIRCSQTHDNLVVTDLRKEDPVYVCGRFLIYALNPNCNISMHLMAGSGEGMTRISVGKSILDRTSKTDIGALLLEYDGGGHEAAGGCRIENDKLDEVVAELIGRINTDG